VAIDPFLVPEHLIDPHRRLGPLNSVLKEQILLHDLPALCLLPDEVETARAILHKPGDPLLLPTRLIIESAYLERVADLMIQPQILASNVVCPK